MRRSQRKPPPDVSAMGLRWLNYKERHRRQNQAIDDAWAAAEADPGDPGLREAYDSIDRLPIRLIACPLGKSVNQGGLLRLGDAFRLDEVSLSLEHDLAYDGAANRGTIARQPHGWEPAPEAIRRAIRDGFTPVALTLSPTAVSITEFDWPCPLALVVGSEADGLDPESLALCPHHVSIPLYGLVTSLNVATAAAIALHDAVSSLRFAHDFQPVRNSSRRLLGIAPADYSEFRLPPEGEASLE